MILHAKMAMPDLQRYPSKICLIKYEIDIHVLYLQAIYFYLMFLRESDLRIPGLATHWNKHFLNEKNDDILYIFDHYRFQEYRYNSGIVIFAWRVLTCLKCLTGLMSSHLLDLLQFTSDWFKKQIKQIEHIDITGTKLWPCSFDKYEQRKLTKVCVRNSDKLNLNFSLHVYPDISSRFFCFRFVQVKQLF